jgi:hypothetical protein
LVVLGWVDGELAQDLAGGGVDDAELPEPSTARRQPNEHQYGQSEIMSIQSSADVSQPRLRGWCVDMKLEEPCVDWSGSWAYIIRRRGGSWTMLA